MINPYEPIQAKIDNVIEESPTIKTFMLSPAKPFYFATGQFAEITLPGVGEAPFTPSSSPLVSEKTEFTIMAAGYVTKALHALKPGDTLGLRGPYGLGYPLEAFRDKEILIVGGGVGLAPLRSLLFALFADIGKYKRISLKYGARTPDDIIYKQSLKEWAKKQNTDVDMSVDKSDGAWKGKVGVVTKLLDGLKIDIKNSVAIVCGPPIMMKFTTLKLLDLGYAHNTIYLSMEKNMSCGIGKCGHCRLGNYYVCKDGPVFTYDKIKDNPEIWE
ncbi:MAG: FAD/NAD(P)-binding protein [Candidatus Omnitrophota bacterium]